MEAIVLEILRFFGENSWPGEVRTLGSLVGDDHRTRELGLKAYQQRRTLSLDESGLNEILDRSAVRLGPLAGFDRYYLLSGWPFEHLQRVVKRLEMLKQRLERLVDRHGSWLTPSALCRVPESIAHFSAGANRLSREFRLLLPVGLC